MTDVVLDSWIRDNWVAEVDEDVAREVSGAAILLVDDEEGPRRALSRLFENTNEVYVAADGSEALELLGAHSVDVMITDIRMPRMSGIELLRTAKERFPCLEVILLTGCARLETAAKAVEWGAFAYLQKPFRNQMIQTYVARAVTRRRQNVERRNLERLALEANRFETLGRVISGMIHDLGSPLQVVSGYIDLMMATPELAPFRNNLETMQNQIQHCTDIVRSTISFLRHKEDTLILLNLNEVVEACLNVAAPILRKQEVEVVRNLDASLSFIQGDFVLVRQSVLNLITNACQAMEGQSAPQRLTFTTWTDDGYVCLGVEDTGPGVPDKDRDNVFQSFFSSKETGGTGLGLSVVKNVADKHGGNVEYGPRNEDTGAHFILRFPQYTMDDN